jgi:hypothetical protein
MRREVLHKSYPGLPKEVHVVVAPNEYDIADIRLRALYKRWNADRSPKSGLVSREIIETREFLPLFRNVMLLEIERPTPFEFDYVYRIYGAEIAERYGKDMAGKRTSEFPSPVAKMFLDLYEMSIDCQAPLYSEHAPPLNVDVMLWERLVLPLGESQIDWILTVNLPKGSRKKADRETATESTPDDQDIVYID